MFDLLRGWSGNGAKHPAALLPLWDISQDMLITTRGCCLKVFEVTGVDSEYVESHALLSMANGLYESAKRDWRNGLFFQIVTVNSRDAVGGRAEGGTNADVDILRYQRSERLRFLRESNLRRHRTYLAVGCYQGMSRREFARCYLDDLILRMRLAHQHAKSVYQNFREAGGPSTKLHLSPLDQTQIVAVLSAMCDPCRSDAGVQGQEAYSWGMSLRERIMRSAASISWDAHHLQIAAGYHCVLSLAGLPAHTRFAMMEQFLGFDFDVRLSVNVRVPDQETRKRKTTLYSNVTHSMVQGINQHRPSEHVKERASEAQQLDHEVAQSKQQYIDCGMQVVISADSRRHLHENVEAFEAKMRSLGFAWHRETGAHDREFFKSLPGMGTAFDRWRTVLSDQAVDLLPLFGACHGDRTTACLLKTVRGELFNFDPAEQARNCWNMAIFGATGSGKSVFVNLLLSTALLSGKSAGPVMVLDYAGKDKSSYHKLLRLFGGVLVPIGDDAGETINPFMPRAEALTDAGKLRTSVHNQVTNFLFLLLELSGTAKSDKFERGIIEAAVRKMYEKTDCALEPIFSDFLSSLVSLRDDEKTSQVLLEDLITLTEHFLSSPNARLFDRRTALRLDSPFVVFDLHGLGALPKNVAAAMSYAICGMVRNRAFGDDFKDQIKWVIIDEGAQQLRFPELLTLVEEALSTSRKHLTGFIIVTQDYDAYRKSGVHKTVAMNTSTTIFFSHEDAPQCQKQVVEDFALTTRQANLFGSLKTQKGRFAQALVKTDIVGQNASYKRAICSKVQVELSPFDYEVTTSDGFDRRNLAERLNVQPDKGLFEVLKTMAKEREDRAHAA